MVRIFQKDLHTYAKSYQDLVIKFAWNLLTFRFSFIFHADKMRWVPSLFLFFFNVFPLSIFSKKLDFFFNGNTGESKGLNNVYAAYVFSLFK